MYTYVRVKGMSSRTPKIFKNQQKLFTYSYHVWIFKNTLQVYKNFTCVKFTQKNFIKSLEHMLLENFRGFCCHYFLYRFCMFFFFFLVESTISHELTTRKIFHSRRYEYVLFLNFAKQFTLISSRSPIRIVNTYTNRCPCL